MRQAKKVSLVLFSQFSQEELLEKSQELSAKVIEQQKVDDDRASVAKQYRERLEQIDATIQSLAKAIRRKGVDKPINCLVNFHDPVPAFKTTMRMDTGEIVKTEDMTPEEKQGILFDEVGALEDMTYDPGDGDKSKDSDGTA